MESHIKQNSLVKVTKCDLPHFYVTENIVFHLKHCLMFMSTSLGNENLTRIAKLKYLHGNTAKVIRGLL